MLLLDPDLQSNIELWFVPKTEYLLLIPVLGLLAELHVKIQKHAGQNRSHLGKGQILACTISRILVIGSSDFLTFPKQFRGPIENGCSTERSSPVYRLSPSHRSGTNFSGSLKFLSEIYALHWWTPTVVYMYTLATLHRN